MTKILPVRLDPSPTVGTTERRSKRLKPVDSARAGRPVTLVRPRFVPVPPSLRHEFIATAAYFKAEARSFAQATSYRSRKSARC